MSEISVFFLHGLVYAGLLFLVSAGLTLVFGMMNVLNFAHAAMYMLGAYFSYSLLRETGNFWLSLLLCPVFLFVIGALTERFLVRRVHSHGHLHELLLTFGLAYVITELVKWIWGNQPLAVNIGGLMGGTVHIFGIIFPIYRLFILACAVLVGVLMAVVLYRTRLGIILRASVNDNEAIKKAGKTDPAAVIKAWEGLTYDGPAGVWTMRACDHQAQVPYWAAEIVKENKFFKHAFVGPATMISAKDVEVSCEETGCKMGK